MAPFIPLKKDNIDLKEKANFYINNKFVDDNNINMEEIVNFFFFFLS